MISSPFHFSFLFFLSPFSPPLSVVLELTLEAPDIVFEAIEMFKIKVKANSTLGSPVVVHVFTISNVTDGYAQGRMRMQSFNRAIVFIT